MTTIKTVGVGRLSGGAVVMHPVALDLPIVVSLVLSSHNCVGEAVDIILYGLGLP